MHRLRRYCEPGLRFRQQKCRHIEVACDLHTLTVRSRHKCPELLGLRLDRGQFVFRLRLKGSGGVQQLTWRLKKS